MFKNIGLETHRHTKNHNTLTQLPEGIFLIFPAKLAIGDMIIQVQLLFLQRKKNYEIFLSFCPPLVRSPAAQKTSKLLDSALAIIGYI